MKPVRSHYIILAITWLAVHAGLFHHFGLRDLHDANLFVKRADFLISHGSFIDTQDIFYSIHISLLALSRILFPGEVIPYLIILSLMSGLATLALYKTSSSIFDSSLAGLMSGLLYLLWWDNIQWDVTAMSESIFCSVTCILIYYLSMYKHSFKDAIRILILLTALLLIRPTGIIMVVGAIVYLISYYWPVLQQNIRLKTSMFSVLALLSVLGSVYMFGLWDFTQQYRAGNIVTYMNTIKGEELYTPSLVIQPIDVKFAEEAYHPAYKMMYFIFMNPMYFIKTASLKIWYLISFTRPYYSTSHNIISLVWISMIYAFGYFGIRRCRNIAIVAFAITIIITNCCLIGISSVDWDNRFFIPMEAGIVLLAGGGVIFLYSLLPLKVTRK